jgi:hypothetical protein
MEGTIRVFGVRKQNAIDKIQIIGHMFHCVLCASMAIILFGASMIHRASKEIVHMLARTVVSNRQFISRSTMCRSG